MTMIGPDVPARVRAFVYEHFLEYAVPPVVERLMTGLLAVP